MKWCLFRDGGEKQLNSEGSGAAPCKPCRTAPGASTDQEEERHPCMTRAPPNPSPRRYVHASIPVTSSELALHGTQVSTKWMRLLRNPSLRSTVQTHPNRLYLQSRSTVFFLYADYSSIHFSTKNRNTFLPVTRHLRGNQHFPTCLTKGKISFFQVTSFSNFTTLFKDSSIFPMV